MSRQIRRIIYVSKTTVMPVTMTIQGDPPFVVSPATNKTTVQSVSMAIAGNNQTFSIRPVE